MLNNKNRTVLSCPVFLLFTFKILLKYSKNFAAAPEREWKRFHAKTAVSSRRGFSGLKTILLSSNKSTAPSMVSPQAAPLLINIAACVIILTVASTFNLLISAPSQLEISFCTYKREGVISGTPSKSAQVTLSCSSCCSWLLKVGCVMCSTSEALVIFSSRATVKKYCSVRSFIFITSAVQFIP